MSNYELTYRSTMCNPKIYALKIVTMSTSMNFFSIMSVFSSEFVSLRKVSSFFERLYGEVTLLSPNYLSHHFYIRMFSFLLLDN